MEGEGECSRGLYLGLSIGDQYYVPKVQKRQKSGVCLDLSFTLCPKQKKEEDHKETAPAGNVRDSGHRDDDHEEEEEEEEKEEDAITNKKRINFNNFHNNNKDISRKKLRLNKEQSALLENSFKLHNTLSPVQKHSLAEQLNLTPRQVEVWFQNRRARTKLKQTEVDCEFLKKWCENLSDENKKLKKELQELKLGIRSAPLCLHLPICTSCDQKTPLGRGPQQQQQQQQ